jgi:hypothetical protein
MPVTMKQVRAHLDPEEPDYSAAAQLGPDAIPHVVRLVQGTDPMLASKAAFLASLIQSNRSIAILEQAANSSRAEVRIAAAAGVRNLKRAPVSLVDTLLKDPDVGVRKVTLRSIEAQPMKGLKAKIEEIAQKDSDGFIRNLASQIAKRLK